MKMPGFSVKPTVTVAEPGVQLRWQRFTKQGGGNGYTACNAGLKRQVEGRATEQDRT